MIDNGIDAQHHAGLHDALGHLMQPGRVIVLGKVIIHRTMRLIERDAQLVRLVALGSNPSLPFRSSKGVFAAHSILIAERRSAPVQYLKARRAQGADGIQAMLRALHRIKHVGRSGKPHVRFLSGRISL